MGLDSCLVVQKTASSDCVAAKQEVTNSQPSAHSLTQPCASESPLPTNCGCHLCTLPLELRAEAHTDHQRQVSGLLRARRHRQHPQDRHVPLAHPMLSL